MYQGSSTGSNDKTPVKINGNQNDTRKRSLSENENLYQGDVTS